MRRLAPIFVLACVALVLFFHQEESPNPLSRLLTPYALVEHHTLQADQWRDAYDKAVVDGDFAMHEDELQNVLKTLHKAGINVVAIHQHMTGEEPRIMFLHYWGIGTPNDLAKALRAALDITRD